ncbi:50S ribosomal protein L6 [Candidatus Parcubacteria bacterium]|nr:MAG: 50S ribosomal protein L6 [Candidatus Parcubacteria bacterium]
MSRIGKQPITIPDGVKVEINGRFIIVKGPKGELSQEINSKVDVAVKGQELTVSVKNPGEKEQSSLWGLTQRLINNMILGTVTPFSKQLEINGVGFKAAVSGNKLVLNVGFSHPVEYRITENINVKVEKNIITISGINKQLVGQTAAEIRAIKKPEPYKGKGIKFIDEVIKKKVGKAAAKGTE